MTFSASLDRFFKITERGSTISTEIKAGVSTFLTMSYILLVNPQILAVAGLPAKQVVTATAVSSMAASLLIGLWCNMPFGMSPGMGLNAYLVYSQVLGAEVSVDAALAGCMAAAGLVALLAAVRLLAIVLAAVPDSIKLATVVGMGLLLTFIGLQSASIVVADPETMVTVGDLLAVKPCVAVVGLALITSLCYRNVRGGILIGILLAAVGYFSIAGGWPTQFVDLPHLRAPRFDWNGLFVKPSAASWNAVMAYALVMIFDIGGAMFGLGNIAGLVKDGAIAGATRAYLSACAGTALGAALGTTPLIISVESAVGIKEGGRTGLVAVVIAGCFGCSLFLAPLLQSVPQVATAPVLVLVGAMMMGESEHIDWRNMLVAVPAFLTVVVQPFTFSIANGIYAGLVMSALVYVLTGACVDVAKEYWALLRGAGGGDAALPPPIDPLDVVEGDMAGGGRLAAPLLAAADSDTLEDGDGAVPPVAAGARTDAISISQQPRRGSRDNGAPHGASGSLSRSAQHLYERASFTMYVNTYGSHPGGGGGGGAGNVLGSPAQQHH